MNGSRRAACMLGIVALIVSVSSTAGAIHWYRTEGPGPNDCKAASGDLTDGSGATPATSAATVMMLHNTFNDASNGTPVTRIEAGQSVTWTWNSAHCHSAQSTGNWNSGFFYPTTPPESPQAVPGLFEYPAPDLTPTLSYTRTFSTPGTYQYFCIHHSAIGMRGVVIVE